MHEQIAFLAAFLLIVFIYSVFTLLENIRGGRGSPHDELRLEDLGDPIGAREAQARSSAVDSVRS